MYWSGPLAAGLLAQYGAEVIKVESVQRVDGWRGMAADPGIERSNIFNGVNLNKSGITLDLTSEAGRDLLKPLVQRADVLIENFSPRVMGNFGLTDDLLHRWQPNLIVLSMPAFGRSGPWRDFVGLLRHRAAVRLARAHRLPGWPARTHRPFDGRPVRRTLRSLCCPRRPSPQEIHRRPGSHRLLAARGDDEPAGPGARRRATRRPCTRPRRKLRAPASHRQGVTRPPATTTGLSSRPPPATPGLGSMRRPRRAGRTMPDFSRPNRGGSMPPLWTC